MAIVLAEVEAAAPHVLISFEGSFAASSSVRHWAGLQPRHFIGLVIRASLLSSSNRLRLDLQALIPVGRGRDTRRHLSA